MALVADALLGDPAGSIAVCRIRSWLIGSAISAAEHGCSNRPAAGGTADWRALPCLPSSAGTATIVGVVLSAGARQVPAGWLFEGLLMSTLLAQRSLVDHVRAVAAGLRGGLAEGRRAVALIVGRDPDRLDAAGVGRAAVESLAENLSDGVVAPLFWGVVAGLPGMLAYKAVNTLDSMVGHRSERYRDFGWASARFDDLVNLVPARLTGRRLVPRRRQPAALGRRPCCATRRGTARPTPAGPRPRWRPPCGLRLAGPRVYAGRTVDDGWMGDGRAEVDARPTSTARSRWPGGSGGCCSRPSPCAALLWA